MALLLWLLTALIPYLLGMGALRVLCGSRTAQENCLADAVLTGGIICIGLAEAAHLTAVVIGWSFSRCVNVFCMGIIGLTLIAGVVIWLQRRRGQIGKLGSFVGHKLTAKQLPGLLFGFFVIGQLIYVLTMQGVYVDGDMTLETVVSFLETDQVYQVNPLTGNSYEPAMPMRLRILCLPSLYGSLCKCFGISPKLLVYGMIPAFVLLGGYLAYYTLAKYFFPEDSYKRACFLLLVAVLFTAGDYLYGMDGFGILHSGFRGVAIRGAILLPYTVSAMLRRKYLLVVLCVLAEACMVWTLYGVGACALVAVGLTAVKLLLGWYDRAKAGREDNYVGTPE